MENGQINTSQILSSCPSNDGQTACEDILTVSSSTIKFKTLCVHCRTTRRARLSDQLKKGSHLTFRPNVNMIVSRILGLCSVYERHAIATEVHLRDSTKVKVKLMEFSKVGGKMLIAESGFKELDLTRDNLFITTHRDKPYTSSQIVSRAKSIQEEYTKSDDKHQRLFTTNCEHYATHCVLGLPVSIEIESRVKNGCRSLLDVLSKCLRLLVYTIMLLHGLILLWTDVSFRILSPAGISVYVLITIFRIDKNYKKQLNNKLCRKCGFAYRKRLKAEMVLFTLVWLVDYLIHFLLKLKDFDNIFLSVGWCAGGFVCYALLRLGLSLYYSKRKLLRLSCA